MARTHGRLFASLWDDEDFIALSPAAKLAFAFVLSQPDLGHAGIIIVRVPPWARRLGLSHAEVEAALDELHAERFVVLDRDELKLLVRSLIRRDGVYKQPNVFKAACDQVRGDASVPIRRAVLAELLRLPVDAMNADTNRNCEALIDWLRTILGPPSPNPSPNPSGTPDCDEWDEPANSAGQQARPNPSPNPSDKSLSRAHARAHSTSTTTSLSTTTSTNHGAPPAAPPAPVAAVPDTPAGKPPGISDADAFEAFWAAYPRREAKAKARVAWTAAIKGGADPAVLTAAARRFADHHTAARTDPAYVPHPATWLRDKRWTDDPEPLPHRARDRPRAATGTDGPGNYHLDEL